MIQKLTKHGNDLALVLDRSTLQSLGIDETTPLEISSDGNSLKIAPLREGEPSLPFQQALDASNTRLEKGLRRLAE